MWADIVLVLKSDFESNLGGALTRHFNGSSDVEDALKYTVWRDTYTPGDIAQVVYARREQLQVFLVYFIGKRTIRIHLEDPVANHSLGSLKRKTEDLIAEFDRFCGRLKLDVMQTRVTINAEDDCVMTGEKQGIWERLQANLSDDIWSKLYVPLSAFVASLAINYLGGTITIRDTVVNVVISIIALLVFLIAEVARSDSFIYKAV